MNDRKQGQPMPPKGPRNLKAGGFTNGLWRLEERAESLRRRSGPSVCSSEAASDVLFSDTGADSLKRNEVFVFEDGQLTIKLSGHEHGNGWGEFAFHERQVEIDADGYHKVEIPPSELRALRDFISRVLEATSSDASETAGGGA